MCVPGPGTDQGNKKTGDWKAEKDKKEAEEYEGMGERRGDYRKCHGLD